MEKELHDFSWREVWRWSWIVASVGLFGLMYYWVLVYASAHTKQGNLILAVLTAVGALGIYLAVVGTNAQFGRLRRRSRYHFGRIAAFVVVLVVTSHIVGFTMPSPEVQRMFVYAPVVAIVAVAFTVIAIGWVRSFRRD
ncbi:MAG: hypothetical protein JWO99_400 [Candidatus Saccharibacteria bacterium]|nr:hypothetical protein [Candidatus Saccharibacteria bacterium]